MNTDLLYAILGKLLVYCLCILSHSVYYSLCVLYYYPLYWSCLSGESLHWPFSPSIVFGAYFLLFQAVN